MQQMQFDNEMSVRFLHSLRETAAYHFFSASVDFLLSVELLLKENLRLLIDAISKGHEIDKYNENN